MSIQPYVYCQSDPELEENEDDKLVELRICEIGKPKVTVNVAMLL